MTQIILYTGNNVSFSPQYAEGRVESSYIRLMADEGQILTNGLVNTICIDVPKVEISLWHEIEYVESDDPTEEEILDIILGR